MTFGQQYVEFVRQRVGKVGHVFEYCAGPGFIGFSLLAHGLCDRLTLADINPVAVEACQHTIERNGLQDRVQVFLSDGLDDIPAEQKWDLVVSNPPHWKGTGAPWERDLRLVDPDFVIHKKLYREVGAHLNPGGKVIIQENGLATRTSDFADMIRGNGLTLVETFPPSRAETDRLHNLRSRVVLYVERVLNTPWAEAVFKKGPLFRRMRETPRKSLEPYYFVWSELGEARESRSGAEANFHERSSAADGVT